MAAVRRLRATGLCGTGWASELRILSPSLLPSAHSTRISIRQAQVDKLYASLKELAGERRERLQEHLRLCQLRRELDDLEQWIQEREVVAASHELGQDYEHVTVSVGRTPAAGQLPEEERTHCGTAALSCAEHPGQGVDRAELALSSQPFHLGGRIVQRGGHSTVYGLGQKGNCQSLFPNGTWQHKVSQFLG